MIIRSYFLRLNMIAMWNKSDGKFELIKDNVAIQDDDENENDNKEEEEEDEEEMSDG